jgi:hypothetical protein
MPWRECHFRVSCESSALCLRPFGECCEGLIWRYGEEKGFSPGWMSVIASSARSIFLDCAPRTFG